MTLGNFIAILISLAALYGSYAFVMTAIVKKPRWPFKGPLD